MFVSNIKRISSVKENIANEVSYNLEWLMEFLC